ncbi:hypothetical protein QP269_25670, partial [Escherichia coli]|nr:hypothetical protein [Escherichia coli]
MKLGQFCAQPRALARAGCGTGCFLGCVLACARGPPAALQSKHASTRINARQCTSHLTTDLSL